jgi:tetratricopeptide (TPR) repeat protein
MVYSIINEEPLPVTAINEDVSSELEEIVNKCLAKSPEERYQSIDDLLADFNEFSKELEISFDESLPKLISRLWGKKLVRRVLFSFGIILILGLSYFLFWPKITAPISIAIISFENQTGDESNNRLSKIIPDLLITTLEQSGQFRVATWERLRDLLKQLGKDSINFINSETGFELCRLEGISNLALGSIVEIGDIVTTDIKIYDVNTKDIVETAQSSGVGVASIHDQIDEITVQIASGLGGMSEEKIMESGVSIGEVTTTNLDAYEYYLKGIENLDSYLFEEARKNLTKAVRLDSTFAMAHIYLAYAYHWVWEFPPEFDIYLGMAIKYRHNVSNKDQLLLDYDYTYLKGLDQSENACALIEAIPLYPKEKQIVKRLAQYYNSKGDLDSAIVFYKKVLDLDPTDKRTLNNIGYMYVKKREYRKAIEYFQRCSDVNPHDHNPFDSMGEVYIMMNEYKKSIDMFQRAFNLNPTGYHYALLSLNYIKMGEFQQARTHLNQWYKKGSSYSDQMWIQLFLAISYLAEGDLQNTQREMENRVMLSKQASDTVHIIRYHFDLAEVLYENGQLNKAEENLTLGNNIIQSATIDPRYENELHRKYLWHMTRLTMKKGDVEQAKKYTEMIKPINFHIYLSLRGIIAYAESDYTKSIIEMNQSGLDDTFTNYYKGLSYIKMGENKEAVECLKRVVDYNDPNWIQNELFRYHANKQLAILQRGE